MGNEQGGFQIRSVTPLPSPEEAAREQRGVVFYRVEAARFPMAETLGAIVGIARLVTSVGPGRRATEPYEMRVGFKWEDDEALYYWVGFNHDAFGAMFEQALRAAGVQWTRRDRARLGAKASNKVLTIANPDVLEARRQELLGNGRRRPQRQRRAPAPAPTPPAPARESSEAPAEKPEKVSPFQLMKQKRAELAGTDLGQRFRRGARGRRRRGEGQTDEQQ